MFQPQVTEMPATGIEIEITQKIEITEEINRALNQLKKIIEKNKDEKNSDYMKILARFIKKITKLLEEEKTNPERERHEELHELAVIALSMIERKWLDIKQTKLLNQEINKYYGSDAQKNKNAMMIFGVTAIIVSTFPYLFLLGPLLAEASSDKLVLLATLFVLGIVLITTAKIRRNYATSSNLSDELNDLRETARCGGNWFSKSETNVEPRQDLTFKTTPSN